MWQSILIRHGQSDQDVKDLTGGWTDTPLTELGRRQAEQAAQYLAQMLKGEGVRLYSSDLLRAAETAKVIGKAMNVEPVARADLRELNNGAAAGLTHAEAKKIELPVTHPTADWRPYPHAESWRMMSDRIFRAMDNIDRETEHTAVVVTHGNSGIAVVAWWLGLPEIWEKKISFELDGGSITHFGINRWGERTIIKLNDTRHLEEPGRQEHQPGLCEREASRRTLAAGQYISLQEIIWRDKRGNERLWETADRRRGAGAVMLIAWLTPSQRLVLIRQYRPPAKAKVIEFPAGLMDEGESVEAAALRELHEETGYRGEVRDLSPAAFNTPGLSNDSACPVLLEIDERLPQNAHPVPHPDEAEEIEVVLVRRDGVADFVQTELAVGSHFDSKVIAYLAGLSA